MNRSLLLIAAGWVALQSTPATAATWVYVTTDINGTNVLIDIISGSEKRDAFGEYKTVWIKKDHSLDSNTQARETKQLLAIKCATREMGVLQYVEYRPNGTVIDSDSRTYPNFKVVVPDTVGETMLESACA